MWLIWDKWQDSIDYRSMQIKIESSNSNEKIENEIHKALNEAYELLRSVRDSGNEELYKRFRQEYIDLYSEIKKSLKSNRDFSKSERLSILLELWDIIKSAEKEWVIEKRSIFDKLLWRHKDNSDSKEKAKDLLDMDIDDYDKEMAIVALEHLNKNYHTTKDATKADKFWEKVTINRSISTLRNKAEVNYFQEKLIKIIIWKENFSKWFNEEYLIWFWNNKDNMQWNYLIKIKEFPKYLKESKVTEINSLALSNYLQYLSDTNKSFITNPELLWWTSKIYKLLKFWNKNKTENWEKVRKLLNKKENRIKFLLKYHKINLEDLLTKDTNDIIKIINKTIKNKTEQKEILWFIEFKRNTNLIENTLNFWLKWFSKLEIEHFKKYKEDVVMVDDKDKFFEILEAIPNLSYEYVNDKFKTDLEFLYKYWKIRKNKWENNEFKLDYIKIKNINLDSLNKEQKDKLYEMIDDTTKQILNYKQKDNINQNIDNKKQLNTTKIIELFNDIDDTTNNKLDNSINNSNIQEIINQLSLWDSINFLYLPKTLNIILNNTKYIKQIIKKDPEFYLKVLNLEQQSSSKYNKDYINSIIQNKDIEDKNYYLSRIRFDNIDNIIQIYQIFKKNKLMGNVWQKLIRQPKFRAILFNFYKENIDEIIRYKEDPIIKEIISIFIQNNKDIQKLKTKTNELKNNANKIKPEIIKNIENLSKKQKNNINLIQEILESDTDEIDSLILSLASNLGYNEYLELLDEILKKVKEKSEKKQEQTTKEINDFISTKTNNKKTLKILWLLNSKWNFDKNLLFKKYYKYILQQKQIAQNKNIDFNLNATKNQFIKDLLKNININIELRKRLTNLINNKIKLEQNITKIKIYWKKDVFEAAKKWDIKTFNKLIIKYDKELKENYYNNIKINNNWRNITKTISKEINNNTSNDTYTTLSTFSSSNWENSFTTSSWITIDGINDKEFKQLWIKETVDKKWKKIIKVWNPEALQNLINLKETLQELNLDFVWKYREDFYKALRNIKWFAEINNLDWDNISKYELMNLLNFILKVIWEWWDFKDEEAAKKKIRDINWWWIAWRKKDLFTELWPIWTIFEQKWYLNRRSSLYVINIEKLQDQNNWKK